MFFNFYFYIYLLWLSDRNGLNLQRIFRESWTNFNDILNFSENLEAEQHSYWFYWYWKPYSVMYVCLYVSTYVLGCAKTSHWLGQIIRRSFLKILALCAFVFKAVYWSTELFLRWIRLFLIGLTRFNKK